ncbi:MAG TPA: VOC family protein [Gemmatimonadales bacterium]|nr:VOC family protein [Gemmatimonadales bacterium]
MAGTSIRGRFTWHELNTSDPDRAVPFYAKVVGWSVAAFEGSPGYRTWMTGATPMGGLMRLTEDARRMGAPPHWLMYVGMPDVDAAVRQAQGLGAKVLVPARTIPTVGRFAVLADPQGAAFAVYAPAMTPGPDAPAALGDFSWHELATSDWQAAWRFYQALFGWDKDETMDMGPAGKYQIFGRAGRQQGGVYNTPSDMPAPPHWLSYVRVANADQAAKTVTGLGGTVVRGPMDVPGGDRIAMCIDPQGVAFAVHSRPAAAPAPARPKRQSQPARKRPAAKRKRAPKRKARVKVKRARRARRPRRPRGRPRR